MSNRTYVLQVSITVNQSKQEMTEEEAYRLQAVIQNQLGYHVTNIAATVRRDPREGQDKSEAPFFNSLETDVSVSSIVQPAPGRKPT